MNNLSDSRDCAFEAFITNLGKYNEGELVGEWVKFPITNDEMQEVFKRIGIGRRYEEWFISDYEFHIPNLYDLCGEYESLSELNYLAGKTVDFVNKNAMNGTVLAHTDGNVPNLMVHIPRQDEYSLGQLFYFFEFACGISGYLTGVNPFNQPGVESYKKNMFALLGKPGYEDRREELLKRL